MQPPVGWGCRAPVHLSLHLACISAGPKSMRSNMEARSPFLPTPPFLPTEPQLYMAQPWCALKSLRSQSTSPVLRKPWHT